MGARRGPKQKECKYCGKSFLGEAQAKYCSRKCAELYHSMFSKITPRGKRKETLCWDCKKATGGGDCPWANEFKPVEEWKATPTIVKVTSQAKSRAAQLQDSYIVRKCPLFAEG